MNIIQAIRDKRCLGALPVFRDLSTWQRWIVCWKAAFGLPLDADELPIFKQHTGRTEPLRAQVRQLVLVIGRQAAKSLTSAMLAVFLAAFHKWDLGLGRGYIQVIACDRRQAQVVFSYIRDILRLPVFRGLVESETREEAHLSNKISIVVQTASHKTSRGFRCVAVIADEVGHWYADGANPAEEILRSLKPSLGSIPGSMLILCSTGFARVGPFYELYRDKFGQDDPDTLCWTGSTLDMNPTYPRAVIEKALKEDYQAAAVEYGVDGQFFRADLEGFLSFDALEEVVIPGRRELPPVQGVNYFAAVDPSGGRGDAMVLSCVHLERDKVVQDCLHVVKPPFDPAPVVADFARALKEYGISQVVGDRYAGSWVSSAFEHEGVSYKNAELTASEAYLEFLPIVMRKSCELLDHKQMVGEFRGLLRRTGRNRDTVDHAPNQHDDASNATALAVVLAAQGAGHSCCIEWQPDRRVDAEGDPDDDDDRPSYIGVLNRLIR